MVKSLRLVIAAISMCFAISVCASTKEYTEDLVVTINGESSDKQPATINVETLDNGNINFTLKNFILVSGEDQMAVGNIAISDLPVTNEGYCKSFSYTGNIEIAAGDKEGVDMWYGPYLGQIPLVLSGKMTDDHLYVTIDIDMTAALGQTIHVVLGEDITGPAVVDTKSYTENLVVTINGESSDPQPATINVETLDNGNINFTLKNFILVSGEDKMPVGNIALSNLTLTDEGYCKSFSYTGNIQIAAGDQEGIDMWYGPYLGQIPLVLTGKMTDDELYVTIDIDMSAALGQIIHVTLGEDIPEGPKVISTDYYTENIKITEGYTTSNYRNKTIDVEYLEDGNYNFVLKNFVYNATEGQINVGTVSIKDIPLTDAGYCDTFTYTGTIKIAAGNKEGVTDWVGPSLGEIPVTLNGKMTEDALYVTLDAEANGKTVNVVLGDDIADGISSVKESANASVIYNLSGSRVNNTVKGHVYVIDGKKIMK